MNKDSIIKLLKKSKLLYKIVRGIYHFVFSNPLIGKLGWIKARYLHSNKSFSYEPCLCGAREYTVFLDYGKHKVIECLKCNLMRSYPKPVHGIYDEGMSVEYDNNPELSIQLKQLFDRLKEGGAEDLNVLDFGCGDGRALKYLNQIGFKNVYGLEISEHLSTKARAKGLTVFDSIEKIPGNVRFDYIIANHVIEHIEDLHEELSRIKTLLRPNAKIIIFVPNIRSKLMRSMYRNLVWDSHYWQFSPDTLSAFIKENGFHIVNCHTITDKSNKNVKVMNPSMNGDEGDNLCLVIMVK